MNQARPTVSAVTAADEGPLLSARGRVAVGPVSAPRVDSGGLSPLGDRPFLLRFVEPIRAGKHDKTGATPPDTTNPDGQTEGGKEDFGLPDYEP